MKVFGHEGYMTALDDLEHWIENQRERLPITQEESGSTTAISHDLESAGSPTTISPWSLRRDPTMFDDFPGIPGDSLSGEMYDMLNLPPQEGDSNMDQSDSLFIDYEQPSIGEYGGSLPSENVQAEPNTSSVSPAKSHRSSWSDIMETSPNINPIQNAITGLSDGRNESDDANATDDSSGASDSNENSDMTDKSSQESTYSVHSDNSHPNATDNSSQGSADDTDKDATDASSRVIVRDPSLDILASDTSNQSGGKGSDSAGPDILTALSKKAQDKFVQSRLDFPCGETVITVNPEEVNDFFQFTKDRMLTTSPINSSILSFAWHATMLVLHSRYLEVEETERAPERKERQVWPIAETYEQVIIPSCYKGHWTLFHINLDERLVWHYDSARSQSELPKKLKEVIQNGLKPRISKGETDISLEFKEAVSPRTQQLV
ncbi:MAG: hypothetical protein Q9194_006738 [Teloschistes cf. exilis]